jgi:4-hydroxy-4-methyl-2-oxoglutarate aldolase
MERHTVTASSVLTRAEFERLRLLDTCLVSNAIERLNVRPRNEGSVAGSVVRCLFPDLPPMLGYAVTGRMRSTSAPVAGRAYYENMDWWRYIASIPEPRVMVVQDVDPRPGAGALVGELHALIGLALHCAGYVTNGSARDVAAVEALGFPLFAGGIAVSHMYAHIADFGHPVELGGVRIAPGDLIHGDRSGVHVVPLSIAAQIPDVAAQIEQEEERIKQLCRSPRFTLRRLSEQLNELHGEGAAARRREP